MQRQGRAIVLAVVGYGLAIIGFGLSRRVDLALGFLTLAGLTDVVSVVFRSSVLQLAVPEGLRGRLTAFKSALAGGGPRLGDGEAAGVAALTTPTFSVVSGGALCILAAAALALKGRALWEHEVPGIQRLDEPDGPTSFEPVPP